MTHKTIANENFSNQTVLIRVDMNVPVKDGAISDTSRINRLKPTMARLIEQGAKIVLLSHFGRPKGQKNTEFSLKFLTDTLTDSFDTNVHFSEDCVGEAAQNTIDAASFGDIVLLENVRFYMGEERNDDEFAQRLSKLGDIYVNDAFSVSHRAHASVDAITKFLPSYSGLLMSEELNALASALENPQRPVLAVVGGSKISTKLDLLNNIIEKVDTLVLGGAMANTFLFAQGHNMGASMCEKDMVDTANSILAKAKELNCDLLLPSDGVIAEKVEPGTDHQTKDIADISGSDLMLDAGEKSVQAFQEAFSQSKTVLWNGPLGVFEVPPFDKGTNALAQYAAKSVNNGDLTAIAGGGDTVAALAHAGAKEDFTYVSTAGGAFLEWLEGKTLPGVAALQRS